MCNKCSNWFGYISNRSHGKLTTFYIYYMVVLSVLQKIYVSRKLLWETYYLCVIISSAYVCTYHIVHHLSEKHTTELVGVLARNFQLHSFKPWQLEAIQSILKKKDVMVVQPTGSGKSLCYQFPPLVSHKMTIVVTPTISLMTDQSLNLSSKGIRSTFLGPAQKDPSAVDRVYRGEVDVVYVTPERLYTTGGELQHPIAKLAKERRIGLVAVDEAHLAWGWSSFR